MPSPGSTFPILSYGGTLSGNFSSIELENLLGETFTVDYSSPGGITIQAHSSAVPEASTLLLLSAGLLLILAARLRRLAGSTRGPVDASKVT